MLTRKKPGAWEVGITTRWHEDDPAGRILPLNYNGESGWIQGRDGNDWFVVCLSAQCEKEDDPLGRKIGGYFLITDHTGEQPPKPGGKAAIGWYTDDMQYIGYVDVKTWEGVK